MNFPQPKAAAGVSKDTCMSTALEKLAEIEDLDSCGRYGRLAREAATALRTLPSSDQCVAREAIIEECASIALAIDSGRGNEKEIAKAILALTNPAPTELEGK